MNERVNDLAAQAGLQPFEDCGPGYVYKMEKFYELIVEHAVECVRDVMRDEQSSLTYTAGAEVQIRLRDYFGVNTNVDPSVSNAN